MSRTYSKNKWKGKEKTRELKHLRKLSTLQRASEKAARANKRQDAHSKKRKAKIAWKKEVERELLEATSNVVDGSDVGDSEDIFSRLEDIT